MTLLAIASVAPGHGLLIVPSLALITHPTVLVILLSLVIGLLMVVVFRYTSDQKAIRVAKDQLKAHMLAVRLFQDQLPVVVRAYGRIVRGTGRYIRLTFKPLLYVILPLTFLIVQLDRYLGWMPLQPAQPFLVEVRTLSPDTLNDVTLQLPPELAATAPAVHIPADNEVVWRVVAAKVGTYNVEANAAGQTFTKQIVVSPDLRRISLVRLRDNFWERMLSSAEPALPGESPLQSITVTYAPRTISFLWMDWNWIVLFFVLSIVAGFIFKSVLGIEI